MLLYGASAALFFGLAVFFLQFELIAFAMLWCAVGWEAVFPSLLCHVAAATQASRVDNMGDTMRESTHISTHILNFLFTFEYTFFPLC